MKNLFLFMFLAAFVSMGCVSYEEAQSRDEGDSRIAEPHIPDPAGPLAVEGVWAVEVTLLDHCWDGSIVSWQNDAIVISKEPATGRTAVVLASYAYFLIYGVVADEGGWTSLNEEFSPWGGEIEDTVSFHGEFTGGEFGFASHLQGYIVRDFPSEHGCSNPEHKIYYQFKGMRDTSGVSRAVGPKG